MASVEYHGKGQRFSRSVPTHSLGVRDAAGELASTDADSPAPSLLAFARDLAYRTHTTGVNPHDAFNQECLLLRSHGLAAWMSGEWQLTKHGWQFLTSTTDPTAA